MKELSIEEKAKAYDERLEKAQKWYDINTNKGYRSIFKDIFPELKESEDEKIRKEMIFYFKEEIPLCSIQEHADKMKEFVAWLEKQGEHANFLNKIQIGDKVTRNEDGVLVNLSQLNRVAKKDEKQGKNNMGISEATKKKLEDSLNEALEKETPESFNKFLDEQGEQKPDNELKFEIGDLITNGILVGKIDEIHEWGYHAYFGDHYADVPDVENWHKWTIQDAKDGDVLTTDTWTFIFKKCQDKSVYYHCAASTFNDFSISDTGEFDSNYVHPATKEQHSLLFQKMHEAGYEWDAEKKELKKAEQKQVIDYPDNLQKDNWELIHEFVNKFGRIPKDEDELNALIQYVLKRQKPAWSEEDEQYKSGLIGLVENSKAGLPINLRGKAADKCIYWLKSLKDRYTWKPSDEQMKVLEYSTRLFSDTERGNYYAGVLKDLYEQLKKLREE